MRQAAGDRERVGTSAPCEMTAPLGWPVVPGRVLDERGVARADTTGSAQATGASAFERVLGHDVAQRARERRVGRDGVGDAAGTSRAPARRSRRRWPRGCAGSGRRCRTSSASPAARGPRPCSIVPSIASTKACPVGISSGTRSPRATPRQRRAARHREADSSASRIGRTTGPWRRAASRRGRRRAAAASKAATSVSCGGARLDVAAQAGAAAVACPWVVAAAHHATGAGAGRLRSINPAGATRSVDCARHAGPALDHRSLYRLPWNLADNPIAWLEPTQACNLACDGCYRKNVKEHKSLDEVQADLDVFARLRNFDGVSIAGGDPARRTRSCPAIVRRVTAHGAQGHHQHQRPRADERAAASS